MKKLIAGNWKLNGDVKTAQALANGVSKAIEENLSLLENNDFLVCPPYLHLGTVKAELKNVLLGGQDCSPFDAGAYTGEVSAAMLKDFGCDYVILGHSERRQYYAESNMMIKQKATLANENGLISIICVGESEVQREAGQAQEVVEKQLLESLPETATAENTVIAYEPVWAIGTGKVATIDDITDIHNFIREKLAEKLANSAPDTYKKLRILYGGSVKPANAVEIFAVENVNGALIGGASLKAEDFIGIAEAS